MKKYIIQDLYTKDYLSIFPSFSMVEDISKASAFMSEDKAIKEAKYAGFHFFAIITVYIW